MSVTAAKGFEAAGIAAGLKSKGGLDLALVVNRGPLQHAAAVFTTNRAKANPIIWSEQVIADGMVSAIVLNSGGANCFTGAEGFQTTHSTAERVAGALKVSGADVLVCSTGLIGDQLDRAKLLAGVDAAVAALATDGGERRVARDHDDRQQSRRRRFARVTAGASAAWRRARGCSPRRSPRCSSCITTDAVLEPAQLNAALRERHAGQLRSARLRRLHVDERPGDAAGERGIRREPDRSTTSDGAHRGVPRPCRAAAGRRRGREPRHPTSRSRTRRPRTTR